jgi:hypothetical protein
MSWFLPYVIELPHLMPLVDDIFSPDAPSKDSMSAFRVNLLSRTHALWGITAANFHIHAYGRKLRACIYKIGKSHHPREDKFKRPSMCDMLGGHLVFFVVNLASYCAEKSVFLDRLDLFRRILMYNQGTPCCLVFNHFDAFQSIVPRVPVPDWLDLPVLQPSINHEARDETTELYLQLRQTFLDVWFEHPSHDQLFSFATSLLQPRPVILHHSVHSIQDADIITTEIEGSREKDLLAALEVVIPGDLCQLVHQYLTLPFEQVIFGPMLETIQARMGQVKKEKARMRVNIYKKK